VDRGIDREQLLAWRRELLWLAPALVAATLIYVGYLLTHPYPAFGAGLFLQIATEIARHNYHLPATIPYYTASGIPFAYPPLGFYLVAVLHAVTGVPHEEMPTHMNAADALLLTSKREGSPNSVKEAMACNLPVVATDVGDVADRLRDVTPSHVCRSDAELVDGLVDVLDRGVPSNGRAAIEPLGLERMAARIRDVYENALA